MNLKKMPTLPELKLEAKEKGIKRYYDMSKKQLLLIFSEPAQEEVILEFNKKKATCEHGRLKVYCSTCCGIKFCIHKKRKDFCLLCGPNVCIHGRLKYYCKQCDGKYICSHKRIKHNCRDCLFPNASNKNLYAIFNNSQSSFI